MLCFYSKWKRLLAFQMDHDTITHNSRSFFSSFSSNCRARMWKFGALELHLCNFPCTIPHTFLANGHSHKTWATVSSCCWQIVPVDLLQHWFADVESILEHARHKKFRTLGGIGSFHSLFQNFLSSLAVECSMFSSCLKRSGPHKLFLPRRHLFFFSFQRSLSRSRFSPSLILWISSTVDCRNVVWSYGQFHCLMWWLIRSATLMFESAPGLN